MKTVLKIPRTGLTAGPAHKILRLDRTKRRHQPPSQNMPFFPRPQRHLMTQQWADDATLVLGKVQGAAR